MKVLIVDDEKRAREGVCLLGEWEKLSIDVIYEAENVEQANEIIVKHQPDIILTDMDMPRKSGIDLMKFTQNLPYPNIVIVVSGYDDYKYTRKTIQYGGFDYLMKPLNEDELNEALSNAVLEVKKLKEKQQQSEELVLANSFYDDQCVSNLVIGKPMAIPDSLKSYFNSKDNYRVIMMNFELEYNKNDVENYYLSNFQFKDKVNNLLSNKGAIAFYCTHHSNAMIIFYPDHSFLDKGVNEIYLNLNKFTNKLSLYVSDAGKLSRDLTVLFNQSIIIRNKRNLFLKKPYPIFYMNDICEKNWSIVHSISNLKLFIVSGNLLEVQNELKHLFAQINIEQCFNIEQIDIWEEEIASLFKRYRKSDKEYIVSSLVFLDDSGAFCTDVLFNSLRKELKKLFNNLSNENRKLNISSEIQIVKEYIEENYNKTIKISEIAEHIFISREYLSRQFKKVTNMTVGDYITKVRLNHSKYLLETTELKIADVAYQSGFTDESYFSKIFKKHYGMSPNNFRLRKGKVIK
ncbi:AraC family transcriptional regulator [Bacillaceae bacterium S4-13-56]